MFLPFGVFSHTKFLAEKFFGAIVAFGIKLMVLAFLANIAFPLLQKYSLPADPSYGDAFCMLIACGSIALLCWQAPGVASAVLAGAPSLTAGTGAQGALAAAIVAASTGGAAAAASKAAGAAFGAASKGGFSAFRHPIQSMRAGSNASGPVDAFKRGQQTGASMLEGKNISSGSNTSQNTPGNRESPLKTKFNQMNKAVPPEEKAGPGAGISLKSGEEE